METTKSDRFLVRSDLSHCGFEINYDKSKWQPVNNFSWIGNDINIHTGYFFASAARIGKLCSDLNGICAKLELSTFTHLKEFESIVAQIISMASSCGKVSQTMTRYLPHIINSRSSWNSVVSFVFVRGTSAAANAGVEVRLFQRHGRWKSVSAKNGYVDDSLVSRLRVS